MQNPTAFAAATVQQILKPHPQPHLQPQLQPPTPQFPEQEQLRCPRCDSTNTKFCYYNNYNLSQPRHFCKSCRRYWTKGGSLRNIPVGGSSRKSTKRSSSSASTADSPAAKRPAASASPSPMASTSSAPPPPGPSGRPADPIRPKPEPAPIGLELPVLTGSFTSLLAASDGQLELGSLLDGIGSGLVQTGNDLGSSGNSNGGLPDLAMFTTPTSGFQLRF